MRAGELDSRIEILHFTQIDDPIYGPQPGAWEVLGKTWASIKHLSGLSTVRQGLELTEVKSSIRIRSRADIDATMQIKHGGTYYRVEAVMPYGKEYIDLVCTTTEHP